MQSIDRAIALLAAFSRARPVLGISELARHTALTRGTTHRLVSALTAHGMLTQVPGSTTYSLGPRLLGLAESARDQLSLDVQAPPVMTWLRDRTGETVGLHILDAVPSRRTIAQIESLQPLRRTYTDLGAARPPHQGAPGKLLLAYAPGTVAQDVVAELARTEPGVADEVAAALDRVRGDGYAISLEERVKGVVALAVPVRDHKGEVAAALSVSVPAVRAGRPELVAMVPVATEAADRLSRRLGHDPAGDPAGTVGEDG
ncbi:IclR family transcriptional regulator [Streptomyces sp. B6B3]|uniref:IclR family transcriptional regulator n=1 Tax=Streptomyces sp. B6B3 TaxID=3153570 RepID=UPI00325D7213